MYRLSGRAVLRHVLLSAFLFSCLINLLSGAVAQQTPTLALSVAAPGTTVMVNGVLTLVVQKQGGIKFTVTKSNGFSGTEARRLHIKVNNPAGTDPIVKVLDPNPQGKYGDEITEFPPSNPVGNLIAKPIEITAIGNIVSTVEIVAELLTDDGKTLTSSAQIRVLPTTPPAKIQFLDGTGKSLNPASLMPYALSMPQGVSVQRRATLYQMEATTDTPGLVTWKSGDPAVQFSVDGIAKSDKVTVEAGTGVYIIGVKTGDQPVSITVSSVLPIDGSINQSFNVTVTPPITEFALDPSPLKIRENETRTVTAKIGAKPLVVAWSLENPEVAGKIVELLPFPSDSSLQSSSTVQVKGKVPGTANLVAEYKADNAAPIRRTLTVTVQPALGAVKFSFKSGSMELFIGRSANVRLQFSKKSDAEAIADADLPEFTVRSSDESILSVTQDNKLSPLDINVTALKDGQAKLIVEVKDEQGNLKAIGSQTFNVNKIGNFEKIKVGLQPMDDRTVADSFGGRLAGEYHVFIVTITNKVGANGSVGSTLKPIIISSASLGVRVLLEKHYNPKLGSNQARRGSTASGFKAAQTGKTPTAKGTFAQDFPPSGWTPLTVSEYRNALAPEPAAGVREVGTVPTPQPNPVKLFPETATIYEAESVQLYFPQQNTHDMCVVWSVDNSAYAYITKEGVLHGLSAGTVRVSAMNKEGKQAEATITILQNDRPYRFTYYPYSSDLILDVVDVRNARTLHNGPFNIARALGTGVSFFTAANVLRGITAAAVLDKYSNLLLPGLERLFPTERDSQRRNLEQRLMKPVERLAAGESIQKLILFPKKSFGGILRGYETRIGEIQTNYLEVEVGVIESTTPESGTPSGSNNAGGN